MFRAMLFTQWKWSRTALALGAVAAFTLPLLSVQRTGMSGTTRFDAEWVLAMVQRWSMWYPTLAAALGLLLASAAWGADHRGKHVYALSLPVPRWHFALMRFAAGAVLIVAPALTFWLGTMLAGVAVQLPPGLHTYAHALSLRFALAAFLSYAVFSAVSAGTARSAGYVLVAVGALVWVQVMLGAAGADVHLLEWIFDRITIWPGPLDVFTGRWTLIDV